MLPCSFILRRFVVAIFLSLSAGLPIPAFAQLPAFPGAQGFGAYATGGRGGDVYYVTNLNNNGAGSLRVGLSTAPATGRTIVFAVAGYIPVVSDTNFNVPSKVTIAGQTAPGGGVGLRGGRMLISGNNVVMRHFRIRHGKNGTGGDCLNIESSAHTTMLDHISMMFSTDENFSFFNSSVNNFTLQYSNSTWGMERHNAGGLWDLQNGSCHHTLWAHHRTRNPKARPNGVLEWINNVTFHWRNEGFIMGDSQTPANWKANVRGCYYISIDDPDSGSTLNSTALTKATVASNGVPNFSLYLDNTLLDDNANGMVDSTKSGYAVVSGSEFTPGDPVGANRYTKSAAPFTGATLAATVTVDDPLTAYKKVVSSAAPLRLDANFTGPLRDELDTLLVDTVVNQYSILVQKDGKVAGEDPNRPNNGEQLLADQYGITNNGFGTLSSATPPVDTDLDGMPDYWEMALNGKDGIGYNAAADDHNTAFTAGQLPKTFFPPGTPAGYTLLEEYLHFRAVPHATSAKNAVQTVDLRRYTDGFSTSPAFTVTSATNGTVQQFLANGVTSSPTGPIIKFTPASDFVGRAGFNFKVVDGGSEWTQQFALLVSGNTVPRDLVWIGDGAANLWNNATSNWQTTSGSATTFAVGDTALFDDRGSNLPDVNISGYLFTGSILVTGTKSYTFAGSGTINSNSNLTKRGSGTLLLSNTGGNSFVTVSLEEGTLAVNTANGLGSADINFLGGNLALGPAQNSTISAPLKFTAPGTITPTSQHTESGNWSGNQTVTMSGGSVLWTVAGNWSAFTGRLNFGGSSTRIRLNGNANTNYGSAAVAIDLGSNNAQLMNRNGDAATPFDIGSLEATGTGTQLHGTQTGTTSSTYRIGALNTDTTFAGTIALSGSALLHVDKVGSGAWTLSSHSTYTGNTTVSQGALFVNGSLGASAVTVKSGAQLGGNGSLGGVVTAASGATLSPGASAGTTGTLTAGGGLSLNSNAIVKFDLRGSLAGPNDLIIVSAGNLTLSSPLNINVQMLDGVLASGTYFLIGGNATQVGSGITMNLTGVPPTTRQTFSPVRQANGQSPAFVNLVVSGTAGSLAWTGAGGGVWDLNGSAGNFSGGPGGDNKFYNLDTATFTDGPANGNVTLSGTLQPKSVVVSSSSLHYTLSGTGSLGGNAVLTKSGAGTLTISTANSYAGGTFLSGGTLEVGTSSALGTGPVYISGGTLLLPNAPTFLNNALVFSNSSAIASLFNGNSTIVNSNVNTMTSVGAATVDLSGVAGILSINGEMSGFSGTLNLGAGSATLRLNSNSSASADVNNGSAAALFNLGTNGARINNRNGDKTIHLGGVEGGSGTRLEGRQSGSGPTATTYVVGALNTDQTFAGTISQGGDDGGVFIVKVGTGKWTLSGTSSFTGALTVDAGTIALSGSLSCTGGADVNSGATLNLLGGTLTVDSLDIATGGTLLGYGAIQGELVNNGNLVLNGGSLSVTGAVVNNGTMRLKNGARLLASLSFQNYGILDLLSAGGGVPSNLENFGIVIDSSGLAVTNAAIKGANFELTIVTYPGHSYQLESSTSLTSGVWTPIGASVAGDGLETTFVHVGGASGNRRFYRVIVN